MGANLGANLASWQFRHNGQWKWQSQSNNSSYTSTNTYIQKAFPDIHGVVTLGDYFTNSDFIDSLPYRGMNISSDDRMLPNSMLGYAPRVRGYAKTNAKVEIRQQGNLIYQTTVPLETLKLMISIPQDLEVSYKFRYLNLMEKFKDILFHILLSLKCYASNEPIFIHLRTISRPKH